MSVLALEVPCPAKCDPAITYQFVGELAGHLQARHGMDRQPAIDKAREVFTAASVHVAVPSFPLDVPVPGVTSNGDGPHDEEPVMAERSCSGCGAKGRRRDSCPTCNAPGKESAVKPPKPAKAEPKPPATKKPPKRLAAGRPPKPSRDPVMTAIDQRIAAERAKLAPINARIAGLVQARELLRPR